ncbi:MAG: DUF2797 domain-containing protein [Myxococcota bacterium]|nr:DUF2797 domain-containing protein [Myxococcota bacterium]
MMIEGQSRKMTTAMGTPVQYSLRLGDESVTLNPFIGRDIQLTFMGKITCIECGRTTKKSFAQGFCFPCMRNSPMNSECIIRPELCRGHLGEGRDVEWELKHHVREHVVYLAVSSEIKVGVTRGDQLPTRWIDQGASSARVIARTPHRCAAGEIEVALKDAFTDRTSWQKMLKNDVLEAPDWAAALERVRATVPESHEQYLVDDEALLSLDYPVTAYPEKVKSTGFDKAPIIAGTLMGIKGQYLLLDENRVLNIRKHNGYHLRFEA